VSIATISTEYVTLGPVTVTADGGEPEVVTSYQVAIAASGATPSLDDFAASQVIDGKVRILVGPGGLVLPRGPYKVWVRYTDSPEAPAFPLAGIFEIV
jgi:hypothetical protein